MVPRPQPGIFVEERDGPPLAIAADEFGALNGLCRVEDAIKFSIAESAEQRSQLVEELGPEIALDVRVAASAVQSTGLCWGVAWGQAEKHPSDQERDANA